MGGRRRGKLPRPTGRDLRRDLDDLRGFLPCLAMPRMATLRSWRPLRGRGRGLLRKLGIGRGWTIGVTRVLGQACFECGDPRGLWLDDGEQLDDHLARHEQCLFPTGGIQRQPCWKWESSHRYTVSYHPTGGLHCSQGLFEPSTHVISARSLPPTPPPPAPPRPGGARRTCPWRGRGRWPWSGRRELAPAGLS